MSAVQKLLKERQAFAKGIAPPAPAPAGLKAIPSTPIPSAAVAGVAGTQPATNAGRAILKTVSGVGSVGVTASGAGKVLEYLFYASLLAFVVFLILTFIHFTIRPIFQLSPTDNALLGSTLAKQDIQTAWQTAPSPDTKAEFTSPKSCDYTVSMDVFLTGEYSSVIAPKVFFYRSQAARTVAANAKVSDLVTALPTTNLIAYIDNETGDLIVAAVTTKNNVKGLESTAPISNLPAKSPFRLSLVIASNFFEVYIDGKLRSTVTLDGTLVTTVDPFWSQPLRFDRSVRVGKLHYWPRTLSSNEIRNLEPVAPSNFFIQKT